MEGEGKGREREGGKGEGKGGRERGGEGEGKGRRRGGEGEGKGRGRGTKGEGKERRGKGKEQLSKISFDAVWTITTGVYLNIHRHYQFG